MGVRRVRVHLAVPTLLLAGAVAGLLAGCTRDPDTGSTGRGTTPTSSSTSRGAALGPGTADNFLLNEMVYSCSKAIPGVWREVEITRPGAGEVTDRYFQPDDEEQFRDFCRATVAIEYHAVIDILRRPDVARVIQADRRAEASVRALAARYIHDPNYLDRILPEFSDVDIHCVIVVHSPEGTRFFLEDGAVPEGEPERYVEVPAVEFLASLNRASDDDVTAFWLGLH